MRGTVRSVSAGGSRREGAVASRGRGEGWRCAEDSLAGAAALKRESESCGDWAARQADEAERGGTGR